MNLDQFREALVTKGYRFYPHQLGRMQKRVETALPGLCNEGRIYITVTMTMIEIAGEEQIHVEMDLTEEYRPGVWSALHVYGVPMQELAENITSFEADLLRAWEALRRAHM